jgi:hypothetical protein
MLPSCALKGREHPSEVCHLPRSWPKHNLRADVLAKLMGVGATVWATVDDYAVWGMVDAKTPKPCLDMLFMDKEGAAEHADWHLAHKGRTLRVVECVVGDHFVVSALK